jgi:hypothetical protein
MTPPDATDDRDILPSTVRDTRSLPDTDYKPLKLGDGMVGVGGAIIVAAYAVHMIFRKRKQEIGENHAGE